MSRRVLIITYYWPPAGGAGVQRWLKFVKYLPQSGFEPYVLTVDPAYATYPVIDQSLGKEVPHSVRVIRTKTREPFGLYKKLFQKKEVPYSGFANEKEAGLPEKISRMIRGNLFIPDARKGWNRYAIQKAGEIIREEHIETVITTGPPHSTHLIGLALKKELNLPWIADLRDPWTDIYYYDKLYHSSLAKKLDSHMEKNVLETADRIIVVSDHMKKMFLTKTAKEISHKIAVIPNGFDEEDFAFPATKPRDEFLITYTGTMTEEYDIGGFMQALHTIIRETAAPVRLRFVGTISPQVKECVKHYGLDAYTTYIEQVPHQEVVTFMKETSALLLAIAHTQGNKALLSGKLFEYLATGNPILGIGPSDGDAATILQECKRGEMFDYHDITGIMGFLSKIVGNWKDNLESLDKTNQTFLKYSRKQLTRQLAELLDSFNDK